MCNTSSVTILYVSISLSFYQEIGTDRAKYPGLTDTRNNTKQEYEHNTQM